MAQERPGPGVAVVVVTFNSGAVIVQCLASVRAALEVAGCLDAPVLVVDNASTDETLALVAAEAPWVTVVSTGGNLGFAAGVNAGLDRAPDRDVLVLNPDVRLAPDCIRELRTGLAATGAGIAVPQLLAADGTVQFSLRHEPRALRQLGAALLGGDRAGRHGSLGEAITRPSAYDHARTVDWATGAVWLVSADCRRSTGRLDERYFLYSEETEYMLRARDRGFAVTYVPDAVAVHLGGEQSSSPALWALSVTNRVRLQRERHGRAAAATMWSAAAVNEAVRAVGRGPAAGAPHRRALRDLVRMPRWPSAPAGRSCVEEVGADEAGGEDEPAYLCFAAQDWWYHNTAHSDFQLMRSIARQRKVLVVNSIGMRMPAPGRSTHVTRRILRKLRSVAKFVRRPVDGLPGFHVMSPLPLPFYGSPALRRLNALLVRAQVRAVCAALRIRQPVVVVTIPTAWDVVRPMARRALVYNRSDRHSDFAEADRSTIQTLERALLGSADLVLYVSRALMADEQEFTGGRALFLDHGVDVEHFRRRAERDLPTDVVTIPRPRVGFFGALDGQVLDFELLERLAAELPNASIVLIGDADQPMDRFARYKNVRWLGRRPYEAIPAYGSAFDVAIMPWVDTDWIRNANPIKLKEYLALGLPVVSTEFAEISRYRDRVRVAGSEDEFVRAVRLSLAEGGPMPADRLRTSVLDVSWDAQAALLVAAVET